VQGREKPTIGETHNARRNHLAEIPCCTDSCNRNSFGGHPETKAMLDGITDRTKRLYRRAANMSEPATVTDFTIVPGVRETASEDGAVLLDIEQGICFSLNPVGLRIWELLKKRCSLDQIADALGQEFPVRRSQLLSDASEFIEALEGKRLIYRPGRPSPKKSWFSKMLLFCKKRPSAH
jgi:Coenzyme PQQ synthesis protein D (PqqD)